MTPSTGDSSRIDGASIPVPTISVAEGGDDGIVLGLAPKQLAVAGVVGGVALLVVIGAVAAGTFFLFTDGNQADTDLVPRDADSIAYVNVDQATSDQAIRTVVDTWYELDASDVDSMDDALAEFENETGLDPDELHHATSFSTYNESTGVGASESTATILRTDWNEDEFVDAMEDESGVTLSKTAYEGVTVYEPQEDPALATASSWVAVLDDGTYVVGTQSAVTDTVDVHNGAAEPIDGDLLSAFEETRNGYIRFAFRLPEERIPARSGQFDTSELRDVSMVSGAYYTSSNSLGVDVTMHATSESAASDIEDVLGGAISLLRGTTQNEEFKEALRDVEVTRDGTTVTVSYENSVESITELLRALDEQSSDDDGSSSGQSAAAVADVDHRIVGEFATDASGPGHGDIASVDRAAVGAPTVPDQPTTAHDQRTTEL